MRISIIGAYGYTGRLICEELEGAGMSFSIFGRNIEKLNALKDELKSVSLVLALDMRVAEDVQQVIENSDIIVNCAGPFTEEAQLLANSTAENGKTYLDITGEVGFIRNSWTRNNSKAQQSEALLIHGCAFESLVADLMIQSLIDNTLRVKSIRSFYWFNQKKISPGTRLTMKLSKYRELLKIVDGDWVIGDATKDQIPVRLSSSEDDFMAVPYPLPEIAYGHWNYQTKSAESYLLLDRNQAMFVGVGNRNDDSAIDVLDKIRKFKQVGPTKDELDIQRSILNIEIEGEDGKKLNAVGNAINMYQTTAVAILLTIQKLINNPGKHSGVLSPAKLFKGEEKETLKALKVEFVTEKSLILSDV